jgi:excisionase family DNA binding protein
VSDAVLGRLLDADDVAAALGVSKDWIYSEVRAGRLPCVRLGRCVRFRAPIIEDWILSLESGKMPTTTKRSRTVDAAGSMAPKG